MGVDILIMKKTVRTIFLLIMAMSKLHNLFEFPVGFCNFNFSEKNTINTSFQVTGYVIICKQQTMKF